MAVAKDGPLEWRAGLSVLTLRVARGVRVESDTSGFFFGGGSILDIGFPDASDEGGDGGVGVSESVDTSDLTGGGVETVGDEAAVRDEVGDRACSADGRLTGVRSR